MKILDRYLLKKYLTAFIFTLLILIPIAIAIDISEKIDHFIRNPFLSIGKIIQEYYINFTLYYANTFMPLALFISVIFFTSKIANNSEIVAINSSRISFQRFLKPYFLGASIIMLFALYMNHLVVPKGNATLRNFEKKYLTTHPRNTTYVDDFSLMLKKGHYIFLQNFGIKTGRGYHFSYEHYEGLQLKYRLTADDIYWSKKDSFYTLKDYRKRYVFKDKDSIIQGAKMDTIFGFTPKDLLYEDYLAKEMTSLELLDFIEISKSRGVKSLEPYYIELYKRTSLPLSSYILTIMAVCLSFRKRKGGVGVNIALGIGLMFLYIFLLKVAEVLGAVPGSNTVLIIWMPNVVFGIVALELYLRAKK